MALYDSERGLLADCLYSQIDIHAQYGGVIPELASRDHIRKTLPLIGEVIDKAGIKQSDIGGVAYTAGPGLVGALLVGAAVGRSVGMGWDVPTIGVHHMEGHLLAPMLMTFSTSHSPRVIKKPLLTVHALYANSIKVSTAPNKPLASGIVLFVHFSSAQGGSSTSLILAFFPDLHTNMDMNFSEFMSMTLSISHLPQRLTLSSTLSVTPCFQPPLKVSSHGFWVWKLNATKRPNPSL